MPGSVFMESGVSAEIRSNESSFYSPSAIVAIFNAATVTKEEKRLIQVKGIFKKTGTVNYNGYYYNSLKDEAADYSVTLLTPVILHNKLDDNKTIEFNGFISRRVDKYGRIEIRLNLVELLAERVNRFSEEEAKKILLINRKIEIGFKDLDALIKTKIFNNERLSVQVIIGRSAIIDSDIKKGMQSALPIFDIVYHRVSLSSSQEVKAKIESLDHAGTDLICVARGGGENLEVFEDLELCESILNCTSIVASAIGHAENVTLFEKLSDKKFITPTQFGTYLKEIYDSTIEELQRSKAKLVQDITQQLSANYDKQIATLQEQLRLSNELHEKTKTDLTKSFSEQLNTANSKLQTVEELAAKTSADKASLHQRELDGLKNQLEGMLKQQSSQEQLIRESRELSAMYQQQLKEAESRRGVSPVIVLLALVAGLIIGLLIAYS